MPRRFIVAVVVLIAGIAAVWWFGRDDQLPLLVDDLRFVGPELSTRLPWADHDDHAVDVCSGRA